MFIEHYKDLQNIKTRPVVCGMGRAFLYGGMRKNLILLFLLCVLKDRRAIPVQPILQRITYFT